MLQLQSVCPPGQDVFTSESSPNLPTHLLNFVTGMWAGQFREMFVQSGYHINPAYMHIKNFLLLFPSTYHHTPSVSSAFTLSPAGPFYF